MTSHGKFFHCYLSEVISVCAISPLYSFFFFQFLILWCVLLIDYWYFSWMSFLYCLWHFHLFLKYLLSTISEPGTLDAVVNKKDKMFLLYGVYILAGTLIRRKISSLFLTVIYPKYFWSSNHSWAFSLLVLLSILYTTLIYIHTIIQRLWHEK